MTVDTPLASPIVQLTPQHLPSSWKTRTGVFAFGFCSASNSAEQHSPAEMCPGSAGSSALAALSICCHRYLWKSPSPGGARTQRRRCRSNRSKRETSPLLSLQLCLQISLSDVLLLFHYCSFCLLVLSTALAFDFTPSAPSPGIFYQCLPGSSLPSDSLFAPAPPKTLFPSPGDGFLRGRAARPELFQG